MNSEVMTTSGDEIDSMRIKDFKIVLKRIDDCPPIRDSTPYIEDSIRVVGEPNPSPDWKEKFEAKLKKESKAMDKSADLSTHKLITRRKGNLIQILMPEPTRGVRKRHFCKKDTLGFTEQVERKRMFQ